MGVVEGTVGEQSEGLFVDGQVAEGCGAWECGGGGVEGEALMEGCCVGADIRSVLEKSCCKIDDDLDLKKVCLLQFEFLDHTTPHDQIRSWQPQL